MLAINQQKVGSVFSHVVSVKLFSIKISPSTSQLQRRILYIIGNVKGRHYFVLTLLEKMPGAWRRGDQGVGERRVARTVGMYVSSSLV